MKEKVDIVAREYTTKLEEALEKIEVRGDAWSVTRSSVESLLDAVKRYLDDSRYYLGDGRAVPALASVSYAEGLLDSLDTLKVAKINWRKK